MSSIEERASETLREYEKAREEKFQEFTKKLTEKIPLFIAIGIAIWWVFYGTVKIYPTTLSIVERVGLTVCTIVLAITYCGLIADGGYKSAKKTQKYIDIENEYNKAVRDGNIYKKEIVEYARNIALGNLYECRKSNLELVGVKYESIFDSDGNYISNVDYKKDKLYSKGQKKIIRKCINTRLVLPTIFGNISGKYFGLKKEETQKQYQAKTSISSAIIRSIVSIFSVGLMFEFVGMSLGSIIYALFQIVLWSASGFSQRLRNFNFVMDILVPQMQEKILIIRGYLDTNMKGGNTNGE